MAELPDADTLFRSFFARWYAADDLARREHPATRPDAEPWGAPGHSALEASPLTLEGQQEAAAQVEGMIAAAVGDWPELIGVSAPPAPDWFEAFDRAYDRAAIDAVIAASDPDDFGNELVVLCCELGAMLGHALQREAPRLEWLYDWPYWESALLDPQAGMRVNVFHWAIRKFSHDAADADLHTKVLQCRDLVRSGWSSRRAN